MIRLWVLVAAAIRRGNIGHAMFGAERLDATVDIAVRGRKSGDWSARPILNKGLRADELMFDRLIRLLGEVGVMMGVRSYFHASIMEVFDVMLLHNRRAILIEALHTSLINIDQSRNLSIGSVPQLGKGMTEILTDSRSWYFAKRSQH